MHRICIVRRLFFITKVSLNLAQEEMDDHSSRMHAKEKKVENIYA
jgi:hypothetical protein